MRVDPIGSYLGPIFVYESEPVDRPRNPFLVSPPTGENAVYSLLENIRQIRSFYLQLRFNTGSYDAAGKPSSATSYERYLQFPNREIARLARTIVAGATGNDEKAYKILAWVRENIQYQTDLKTYGSPEYWALPSVTLHKGEGDCEDGAFLVHSLMLNAGITYDHIRTYGGTVFDGLGGAQDGGHGWTAYRRETDGQWIALDWCYYPAEQAISDRLPLRDDPKYVDDSFYVDALGTIDGTYVNHLRGAFVDVVA